MEYKYQMYTSACAEWHLYALCSECAELMYRFDFTS